jgi:hypothetical protein
MAISLIFRRTLSSLTSSAFSRRLREAMSETIWDIFGVHAVSVDRNLLQGRSDDDDDRSDSLENILNFGKIGKRRNTSKLVLCVLGVDFDSKRYFYYLLICRLA